MKPNPKVYIIYGMSANPYYIGRTVQTLACRIKQHLSPKSSSGLLAMHVTRVEYVVLDTIADMIVAESYFINKTRPFLNQEDRSWKDSLTFKCDYLDGLKWKSWEGLDMLKIN